MKRKLPSPEKIKELYWDKQLSASEIAKLYSTVKSTVYSFMRYHQIPRRSKKDATHLCILQNKRIKRPRIKTKIKKIVRCRKCWYVFEPIQDTIRVKCPKCGNLIDRRIQTYSSADLEKRKIKFNILKKNYPKSKSLSNVHLSALYRIGGVYPKCKNCGCDDVRLLEINHKFGGGGKEFKEKGAKFYWEIIQGKRKVDDLEINCKVCNALHYLKLKYGELPYEIKWNKYEEK